jgi:hypothetical protein
MTAHHPTPDDIARTERQISALAHNLAGTIGMPAATIRRVHAHFSSAIFDAKRHGADLPAQMAILEEAQAALQSFAQMPMEQRAPLWERDTMYRRHGYDPAAVKAAERVIAEHPLLAPIFARIAAEDEAAAELQRAAEEQRQRDAEKAAPGEILATLRARGIHLAIDEDGALIAPRGSEIGAEERMRIVRYKAGIVAQLQAEAEAEAEAARPLVIA